MRICSSRLPKVIPTQVGHFAAPLSGRFRRRCWPIGVVPDERERWSKSSVDEWTLLRRGSTNAELFVIAKRAKLCTVLARDQRVDRNLLRFAMSLRGRTFCQERLEHLLQIRCSGCIGSGHDGLDLKEDSADVVYGPVRQADDLIIVQTVGIHHKPLQRCTALGELVPLRMGSRNPPSENLMIPWLASTGNGLMEITSNSRWRLLAV